MFLSHEEYEDKRKDDRTNDNLSNPRESVDLIEDPCASHEEKGRSKKNKVEDTQSFEDTREKSMDPAFDTRKPVSDQILCVISQRLRYTVQELPELKRFLFCLGTLFFHIFVSTLTV